MRSVPVRALIFGVALVAGCKPEPFRPDAGPLPDGPPPYWSPKPMEAANWDIQLAATPFDVSMPRAMYVIDLWDAVPTSTPLDYGDGAPVMVPAGKHPGAIAQIHAQSPPAIVVCHVSTGAIRLNDPDAMKFPGYEANPPNRPAPLAPGSVIGWSITDANPSERFIDIHTASRDKVAPLIGKRIELAKAIGCDAIAAQYNDQLAYQDSHGFSGLTPDEYTSWSQELATRAHTIELSIGLRAPTDLGIGGTSSIYDWLLIDRCGQYDTCDTAQTYLSSQKAVFAIEYDKDEEGDPNNATALCQNITSARIKDAIIKTAALDSSYRMTCGM